MIIKSGILTILIGVLFLSCGVEFQKLSIAPANEDESMYEQTDPIARGRQAMKEFDANVIYTDKGFDEVWGMEKDDCKDFKFTDQVVYAGKAAIELKWDKGVGGCKWMGFGIGWNGWAGKQIGDIIPVAAFEFNIKAANQSIQEFNSVMLIEDYSGMFTTASVSNRSYYERGALDTEWQKITVPLSDFPFELSEGDPDNIKQLIFEVNGSGHVFVDEIKIVELENPVLADKQQTPVVTSKKTSPFKGFNAVDIYSGDLSSMWGLEKNSCKDFKTNPMYAYNGVAGLDLD
ncbi:MAG: hypothetical protein HKN92_00570, partial [Chitinophagales bacterium]|nr:hypothetical protein [Chitinophagales bacterium]